MVALRLREMQRAGGRPGIHVPALRRLPVVLQRVPHRARVLRGRLLSMTSSTSCSTSQSARPRRSAGAVPPFWRSK